MILQGNQRGGARNLARHLLKDENEHVEIHELRGFVANDLPGALDEAHAVSRGTKARQFLFCLSLNPPSQERVSTASFEDAINRAESRLGLEGQPRAIVFHEKNGRRHAHAVWSRIDPAGMKAVQLSYTKRKLMDLSRELYLEHGWQMPKGMVRKQDRDPRNYTLAEWQQAKRQGKNAPAVKATMQDCWAISDTQAAFSSALRANGYILARGDRRGFVAIDHRAEVYSVSKYVGVRVKEVRAKLIDEKALPSVQEAKTLLAGEMGERLKALEAKEQATIQARLKVLQERIQALAEGHRQKRQQLEEKQAKRRESETRQRQARLATGLRGFVQLVSGRKHVIKQQNERETYRSYERDRDERDRLIFGQLWAREKLQSRIQRLDEFGQARKHALGLERAQYEAIKRNERERFEPPEATPRRRRGPELSL